MSAVGVFLLTLRTGAELIGAAKVWAAAALCIAAPGRLAAQKLHSDAKGLGATLTAVWGFGLFSLCTAAASASGLYGLVWLPAAAGVWQLIRAARGRALRGSSLPWGPLCFLSAVLVLLSAFAAQTTAHPARMGALIPEQDFFWNVGNAQSFLLGLPVADLRFAGVELRYHFLTELIAAGLSMATGVSCYDVRGFFETPVLLAFLVPVLWELAGAFMEKAEPRKRWLFLGTVFALASAGMWKLLDDGTCPFWNMSLRHVITNVNGMTTALLFVAAFSSVWCTLARCGLRTAGGMRLASAGVAAFALALFAKAPVAALAALGALAAAVVLLLRRDRRAAGAAVYTALLFALFLAVYLGYFSSSTSANMTLSLSATLEKSYFKNYMALLETKSHALWLCSLPLFMLGQAMCMSPAVFLVFAWGGVRDLLHIRTCPAARLYASALAVGGMLAFFLFDQASMSQMYFAFAGLFFMGLLAADALPELLLTALGKSRMVRCALCVLTAVSLFTALCAAAQMVTGGLRVQPASVQQLYEQQPSRTPLTAQEEQGMAVLREAMAPDELFVTNRMHTGIAEEGLSNVYTGLSGRQSYMESFKYAEQPWEKAEPRWNAIQELFSEDTQPERARELCGQMGVSYIAYCPLESGSDAPFAGFEVLYDSEYLTIYIV